MILQLDNTNLAKGKGNMFKILRNDLASYKYTKTI